MTRVGTEADRFFIIETQEAQLFQLANEISVCVCVCDWECVCVCVNKYYNKTKGSNHNKETRNAVNTVYVIGL